MRPSSIFLCGCIAILLCGLAIAIRQVERQKDLLNQYREAVSDLQRLDKLRSEHIHAIQDHNAVKKQSYHLWHSFTAFKVANFTAKRYLERNPPGPEDIQNIISADSLTMIKYGL